MQPFVAEMTTLLSICQTSLPFGVMAPQLPQIDTVHKYTYVLDRLPLEPEPAPNHFVLIFANDEMRMSFEGELRELLMDDENGAPYPQYKRWRESGINSLTTWIWNRAERRASFWMREDLMSSLRSENWSMSIWRTDN